MQKYPLFFVFVFIAFLATFFFLAASRLFFNFFPISWEKKDGKKKLNISQKPKKKKRKEMQQIWIFKSYARGKLRQFFFSGLMLSTEDDKALDKTKLIHYNFK